jgi:crotonobetainyl-CoA:carnitine CoA-transferase CaiB-like acyl-CoA transferase
MKGFLPGPYEKRIAMDEIVQMMGGLAYMTGPPGKPTRAGTSIIDITGGMFAVIGILTALIDRNRTGKGTFVRSALFETTAFVMGQHMAYAALTDGPVPPMPARVSAWSIYRLFETKDGGNVFIGIISEKHWEIFCKAFDRMDLFQDERLGSNNDRIRQREWLLPEIENMVRQLTTSEVIERCDQAGVPFAPIARPEDLFDDPHLNQASGLLETTFPSGVKTKMPRIPIQIEPYDFNLQTDPPAIGAHTRETLERVGYKADEIQRFLDHGVVTATS